MNVKTYSLVFPFTLSRFSGLLSNISRQILIIIIGAGFPYIGKNIKFYILNLLFTQKRNARARLSIFFARAKIVFFRETLNQGQPRSSQKLVIFNNNKNPRNSHVSSEPVCVFWYVFFLLKTYLKSQRVFCSLAADINENWGSNWNQKSLMLSLSHAQVSNRATT